MWKFNLRFTQSNGASSLSEVRIPSDSVSDEFLPRYLREWSEGFKLVGLLFLSTRGLAAGVDGCASDLQESLTMGGPRY